MNVRAAQRWYGIELSELLAAWYVFRTTIDVVVVELELHMHEQGWEEAQAVDGMKFVVPQSISGNRYSDYPEAEEELPFSLIQLLDCVLVDGVGEE